MLLPRFGQIAPPGPDEELGRTVIVSIQVSCPQCSSLLTVAEQHLGKLVRCARCGQTFTATAPPEPEPEAEAEPVASEEELFEDFLSDVSLEPPTPVHPLRFEVGGATSPGRVRDRNEDSFLVQHLSWANLDRRNEIAAVVVADGMGGHAAGDRASGIVIRTVGGTFAPLLAGALNGDLQGCSPPFLLATIDSALRGANRTVLDSARTDPACKGMGATAAVVIAWGEQAVLGHVGDCRIYHFHAGQLTQVTRDQTLVARMVELGKLTPEEALTHPARNEVAQAVGRQSDLEPSRGEVPLQRGDWLIVACDGLQAHLDRDTIAGEINQATGALPLAQRLVELADERGGSDNCTVVALRCC
jgi:protein phosphatase